MKNIVLSLFAAFCLSACGSGSPGPECRRDSDCYSDEICDYGWCTYHPSYLLSGAWTEDCSCWDNHIFAGDLRRNDFCITGYDIAVFCDGRCPEGGYPLGRVCE